MSDPTQPPTALGTSTDLGWGGGASTVEPPVERATVAIYRATQFKPSETFIRQQASALLAYRPAMVGLVSAASPSSPELAPRLAHPGVRTASSLLVGAAPRALTSAVAAADPALVHAHFGPDGVQVLPVARRLDLPLVVTLHGHDVLVRGRFPRTPQRLAYLARRTRLLRQADLVICVSDFLHRTLLAQHPPPQARIVRHHIGIDVERLVDHASTEPSARETICFVGRLTAKKGIGDLARSIRLLRRRGRRNPVEIIGDGPLAPVVADLVAEVPDVTWHGARPHTEVVELFGRSRLAILPSQTGPDGDAESLGLVFAEAIARGCVPVGYRHGGVGEVTPDALLVEEGDVQALIATAETILCSPTAGTEHLAEGLSLIRRRFDLAKQTAELEGLYDDLVG